MTTRSRLTTVAFILIFVSAIHSAFAEQKDNLTSPSGFRAVFVKLPGEGEGKTVIHDKDGKKIAEIANSRPAAFSPTQDILLVMEYAPDDDCRQYLLDIGKGEFAKKGDRNDYVFGGRYVHKVTWSVDGKVITLHPPKDMGLVDATYKVAEVLKSAE